MDPRLKYLVVLANLCMAIACAHAGESMPDVICGVGENKDSPEKVLMTFSFAQSKNEGRGGLGLIYACMGKGEADTQAGITRLIDSVEKRKKIQGVTPMLIKVLTR